MALALTAFTPTRAGPEGGSALTLTGSFPLGVPLLVYVVPAAGSPVACLSGVSGAPRAMQALTATQLTAFTPALRINSATTASVNVQNPATGEAATLAGLLIRPAHFKTGTYSLRGAFPPTWATGPRSLVTEGAPGTLPSAPTALAPQLIQALTSALGDELTSAGGARVTRLTANLPIGQTTLPLERSIDLPSPGKLLVDGVSYVYTAAGDGVVTGVGYRLGGQIVAGTKIAHSALAAAVDISATYSALDVVRASLLVDTATGRDLEAIGRNLGVPRSTNVTNDALYRGIIEALAYAPRGTVLALIEALDALLGAGTYALSEDLVSAPNQASLRISQSALPYANTSVGKTYLTPAQVYQSTAREAAFVSSAPTARTTSVTSNIEAFVTDCRTALPTTRTLPAQFPGDAGQLVWSNPQEAGKASIQPAYGGCTQLSATAGICVWSHLFNLTPNGSWTFGALVAFPVGTTMPASGTALQMTFNDGARALAVGFVAAAGGWSIACSVPAVTTSVVVPFGVPAEVSMSRSGPLTASSVVELRVNGALVAQVLYSALASVAVPPRFNIGRSDNVSTVQMQIKQLAVSARDPTDFWSYTTTAQAAAPATLTTSAATFTAADVGKRVRVTGSAATNAQGGSNACTAVISQVVSSTQVTLAGAPGLGAQVSASAPNRLVVPGAMGPFTYPTDLGKQVVISGSGAGNNGTYVITNLYDVGTGRDLASFATSAGMTTNACALAGAAFSSESNLSYALAPVLVAEASVPIELSDAGTQGAASGGSYPLTLRNGGLLPNIALRCQVEASTYLSAQLLAPSTTVNGAAGAGYRYYPAYVDDPLALLTAYVKQVLPAGAQLNIATY